MLAIQALDKLKESHCKLSLAEFINEALEIFFSKQLDQSFKKLEKKFFDRKKYLKRLLQTDSGQDFDESLKNLVKKISAPQKKVKVDEGS